MADRRVTFDRAVSREPLALAADATSYARGMVFWYFRTDLLGARRTRGGVCKGTVRCYRNVSFAART
jgi:hypothetical protein